MISDIGLRSFPEELYRFKNAKIIDLSNNQINRLDIDLRKFSKLHTLILNKNYLNEQSIKFKRNKKASENRF